MQIIAQKNTENLRLLVGTFKDYNLRYKLIEKTLNQAGVFNIFAEPKISINKILWRTTHSGKSTNYNNLSADDKAFVDNFLASTLNQISTVFKKNEKLSHNIEEYFGVPDNDSKYLIETGNDKKAIIIQWGAKFDNSEQTKLSVKADDDFPVPVIFKLRFTTGEDAPNEKVFLNYNNKSFEETANQNAIIDFGKVFINKKINSWQVINTDEQVNYQEHICDGRTEYYYIDVAPYQTMIFVAKYDDGKTATNINFHFELSDEKKELNSGEKGLMSLEKIKPKTKVIVYTLENDKKSYEKEFVCVEGKDKYEIILPTPPPPPPPVVEPVIDDVKVQLINKKKNPIANIRIDFQYLSTEKTETTNENGECLLNGVNITNPIRLIYKVHYKKAKIPWSLRFKNKNYKQINKKRQKIRKIDIEKGVEKYIIQIRKRCLWCLLLLLLPLLLLIRINKNIDYIVKNACESISVENKTVAINYTYTEEEINKEKQTDKKGKVSFKIKGRRIYEIIFGLNKQDFDVEANLIENGSSIVKNVSNINDLLKKETVLYVPIKYSDITFTVFSKKQPDFRIEQAKLDFIVNYNGKDSVFTAYSDTNGIYKIKCPECTDYISVNASNEGYYYDEIIKRQLDVFKNNEDSCYLFLQPVLYSLDIVMCIDATGSMDVIISQVKSRALTFYEDLVQKMEDVDKYTEGIRVRVIAYRDFYEAEPEAIEEVDFILLPDNATEYSDELQGLIANGGGDTPESSLEALTFAFNSDWTTKGDHKRQIIVLWTNAPPLPLDDPRRESCANYPDDIPANLIELEEKWDKISETARLVIFAPESGWTKIKNEWKNVTFIQIERNLDENDYNKAIEEIAKNI